MGLENIANLHVRRKTLKFLFATVQYDVLNNLDVALSPRRLAVHQIQPYLANITDNGHELNCLLGRGLLKTTCLVIWFKNRFGVHLSFVCTLHTRFGD